MKAILITLQLKETDGYLHSHQSRCRVRGPLQMRSGRTSLRKGWRTHTPRLPCQTHALQHLGSHLSASRKYCSDECNPHALSPAANKGKMTDLSLWIKNNNNKKKNS